MTPTFERPSIILVEPQIPENIGAVCRSMSNYGFHKLILVNPCDYLNEACQKLAMFAYFIAEQAHVVDSLEEALTSTVLSFGFTRRQGRLRRLDGPYHTVLTQAQERRSNWLSQSALVFGRESSGLLREEAQQCSLLVELPTVPEHGSMNLSHAVACACYETTRTLSEASSPQWSQESQDSLLQARQEAYNSLVRWLDDLDFYTAEPREFLLQRIKEILDHSLLQDTELLSIKKSIEKLRRLYSKANETLPSSSSKGETNPDGKIGRN